MMIRVVTDSVASLPQDLVEDLNIDVVSLFVHHEGKEYDDATMDLDDFYSHIYEMVDNIPTSSQPSQADLEELFEGYAQAGDEVLGIWISTELSGTYDGALRAARAVESRNIGFKYVMINSTSCGFDEGWVVVDGAEAVASGSTLEEAAQTVLKSIASTRFLFTPENLTFLKKGGRIGGAAALIGNLMRISPVLTVKDGTAPSRSEGALAQEGAHAHHRDARGRYRGKWWLEASCRSVYRRQGPCSGVGKRSGRAAHQEVGARAAGQSRDRFACWPSDRHCL